MQTTSNYALKKPEATDYYNIDDFNANMDTIDVKIKLNADNSASHAANTSNPHSVNLKQVGGSNKNLLDNWDFTNPVNQRMGYIVKSGTTYYSEESLTGTTAVLSAPKEARYINETYGEIVLNNVTFYVSRSDMVPGCIGSSSGIYFIDRWKVVKWANDSFAELTDDGIKLTCGTATGVRLIQVIDNAAQFAGKTVTLSVETTALTNSLDVYFVENGSNVGVGYSKNTPGISTFTVTLPAGLTSLSVFIQTTGVSNSVSVSRIKLELGTGSTLANDFHSDYSEELERCQRYFETTGYIVQNMWSGSGNSWSFSEWIKFRTPKRIVPTVTVYARDGSSGKYSAYATSTWNSSYSCRTDSASIYGCRIASDVHGTQSSYSYRLDASADL